MTVKKLAAFALAAATFAAGAFAEIVTSGGADMIVVPFQMVTRDTAEDDGNVWIGAGVGQTAAMAGIRTRLNLIGNFNDTIGFRTDVWFLYSNDGANLWEGVHGSAMEVRLGLNGKLWWSPSDRFRLDVGRVFNTSQMGRVGFHELSIWTVGMQGGGSIFSPHFSYSIGILGRFSPPQIEELSIYAFVPFFGMPFDRPGYDFPWMPGSLLTPGADRLHDPDDDSLNRHRLFRVLQRTWLTVGYEVSERFHARVQFAGANPSGLVNWTSGAGEYRDATHFHRLRVGVNAPRFEAAFAWLGTPGLTVDFGVRTWLPVSDWLTDTRSQDLDNPGYVRLADTGTFWGGLGFGLGVSYDVNDELTVNFRADGGFLRGWNWNGNVRESPHMGITRVANPVTLSFHLWPEYTLPNGMRLTLSAGLNYLGRNTVDRNGADLNAGCPDWDRSNRLRFGGGLSLAIPVPVGGASSLSVGLAYSHGTADVRGGEARVVTVPISFFFNF